MNEGGGSSGCQTGMESEWAGDGTHRSRKETAEPSGRRNDLKHSDHVLVLIDTRHTANVHRATEFCTALQILPADEAADDQPTVQFVEIGQQRNTRRDQDAKRVVVSVETVSDGYRMELWIPAAQIPGFAESPEIGHIGFYVVVEDTELGQLPLSIGDDFPVAHDPSTWLQLNLDAHNTPPMARRFGGIRVSSGSCSAGRSTCWVSREILVCSSA